MKKRTKAAIATGVAAVGIATGSLLYSPKTAEEVSIDQQITQLEQVMKEKEAKGEGTTITRQEIERLKEKKESLNF